MYSVTLQNPSDTIISSGHKLGYLNFSAPNESDGGAAKAIVGSICTQAEGAFSESSSPASLIFGTSDSNALGVVSRLKISESGHVLPMSSGSYNLGSTSLPFRNTHATTGTFSILQYAAAKPAILTNTDGPNITFDLNASDLHTVTIGTGNRTLALSNASVGQKFIIRLVQGVSGSGTVSWFSTIKWPGALVPTLTTTATKTDIFGFICSSGNTYDGFVIGYDL
jgi:hypothetical protein